jgi:hypothetical protein
MTTRIKIPTVGGSYQHDSKPFDSQLTINLFPERGGPQSKSPAILRRTPGSNLFVNIPGTGPIRGEYATSTGRHFAVRDNIPREISSTGTLTDRGYLNSASGVVNMTDYGTAMAIADGTNIYEYDLSTNALTAVTDASAPDNTPVVDMADGYIFGFDPDSEILGRFGHSNINDVTTWNALDFYNAEGSPDKLIMLKVLNREVWLFGSKSFEVYYNRGGDNTGNNPTWARRMGTFKQIGCGAKNSVTVIGGKIFWLGASKDGENIIWTADGYQPRRISTRALESEISTFSSVEDAESFTYEYEGHYFYCLTFNVGNKTFVYDVTEGEWHNWAHRNTTTGVQQRHRAVTHAFVNRTNYVGDYANGNIYELSKTTYTDNGDPITWERQFPYFDTMERRLSWFMLQIDALTGTAELDNTIDVIQIRWSDDGGRTWKNWHPMSLGKRGEYGTRVMKWMLGMSRDRIYHIRSSEPIPMTIQDNTVADVEVSDD